MLSFDRVLFAVSRTLRKLVTPDLVTCVWNWCRRILKGRNEAVAQLVRASDRHAADAGSIPRRGRGF